MSDTLINMRTFLAAVELNSFAAAAREMNIARSVVTKRVGQLEWTLKTQLLIRTTRRLHLTEDGELYLERIRNLIRTFDEVTANGITDDQIQGHLRVRCPAPPFLLDFEQILVAFATRHPGLTFDVSNGSERIDGNKEGLDVIFTMMQVEVEDAQEVLIMPYRRTVCCSPAYLAQMPLPNHPRDLLEHRCIVSRKNVANWIFWGKDGVTSVAVKPVMLTPSPTMSLRAALAGLGMTLIHEALVADHIAAGDLVRVLPDYELEKLWLRALIPADRMKFVRVTALVDYVKQIAGRHGANEFRYRDARLG